MTDILEQEKQLLENFVCDKELKELEKKFDKFNIFDCLRLTRAEIRHSNFLAWLLDPNETHGFNNLFLKEFLKEVLKTKKDEIRNINGYNIPSIIDVDCWNMSDVQIFRELQNIDLLLVDESNKFVLVIENKIDTCQHDNQLTRYKEYVDNQYLSSEYSKLFIYLKPKAEQVEPPYIHINYELVKNILKDLIKEYKEILNDEVVMAIQHYTSIIERDIMEKDEIKTLCRKIYANHKKALELINKYSDSRAEIHEALIELIEQDDDLILEKSDKNWIRFIPKAADSAELNIAKKDWVESDRVLLFEIHNDRNSVYMDIIIRQTNEDDKLKILLDLAKKHFNFSNSKKDSYKHIMSACLVAHDKYDEIILKDCDELQKYLIKAIQNTGLIRKFNEFVEDFQNNI